MSHIRSLPARRRLVAAPLVARCALLGQRRTGPARVDRPRDRSLRATRALLLATTLAAPMLAHGASVLLRSSHHEALLCSVESVSRRGGHSVATPAWSWVVPFAHTRFELGSLYASADGDSPHFHSLTLRCVRRDRMTVGEVPRADEPTYSIELKRLDPLWNVPIPGTLEWTRQFPRNGTRVAFKLSATGLPQQPLRIVRATLSEDRPQPGWKLRYMLDGHDFRLVADGASEATDAFDALGPADAIDWTESIRSSTSSETSETSDSSF